MTSLFRSRVQAGQKLARALDAYRGRDALVLAIPKGGVIPAAVVADELGASLDIVVVQRLPSPLTPRLGIGAIAETGAERLGPEAKDVEPAYIERMRAERLAVARKLRERYTPGRAPCDAHGRVAIVIDDGLADPATMIAALEAARSRQPARLVCAIPVGARLALDEVRPYADELVCLQIPKEFYATGQFYIDYPQLDDEDVVTCLSTDASPSNPGRTAMYQNILVPVDGSSHSVRAVREATRLAKEVHAKLTLLHVLPSAHKPLYTEGLEARETREEKDWDKAAAENKGRTILQNATDLTDGAQVKTSLVADGSPSAAILQAAAENDCDVIVMGTRGYSGIAGTLVGSQTQKVLAKATVPGLVIH
jgi:putative phosphoribosyl transferase